MKQFVNEALLHYIWAHQLYSHRSLKSTDGQSIQVVYPGKLNRNQGPDFSDARIRVGETLWIGHVELHVQTSDWEMHKHSNDPNYRQVVLHVVWEHDQDIESEFPTLELKSRIPKWVLKTKEKQKEQSGNLICSGNQPSRYRSIWENWKSELAEQRLLQKSDQLLSDLKKVKGNWELLSRIQFAKQLVGPVNAEAMESLLQSIPESVLRKHRAVLIDLEALMFGQAGFLEQDLPTDPLIGHYAKQYRYQQKMHGLIPSYGSFFFHRMRPGNFPTLRIAQMASCLHQIPSLMTWLLSVDRPQDLNLLESIAASNYWDYRYRFGAAGHKLIKRIGHQKKEQLIINWAIPILYTYGRYHGVLPVQRKSLSWLVSLSPEDHFITRIFEKEAITIENAHDSQAVIALYKNYCQEKKCMECKIGKAMLQHEQMNIVRK